MEVEEDSNQADNRIENLPINYYYLDIQLDFANPDVISNLTDVLIKKNILSSVKTLFGEYGAAIPIDLLKFEAAEKRVILRCPASFYVKLRSALTLSTSCEGYECYFRVVNASPFLIALYNNSRTYFHGI